MLFRKSINERKQIEDNVNRKVHWYGFEDLITKPESLTHPLAKLLYAIDYDFSYPLITYLLTNRMHDLEEIVHDQAVIQNLNDIGITVYLNEPLSLRYENGFLMAEELDSIMIYMENNKLTNITVYTCDYRCEELLPCYSKLKLITDDIFIKTINRTVATLPTANFTKKFINLNWRYTDHRHIVAAFMHRLDGYCSWNYIVDDENVNIYDWINIDKLDEQFDGRVLAGITNLKSVAPIKVDIAGPIVRVGKISSIHDINRPEHAIKSPEGTGLEDIEQFYADVFCDVVTETKFAQPTGNISEKTFRPIGYRKPFILVAPPHSLEYIRSMGYKTFSDYWDESYDVEEDHHTRIAKIFKLVEYLDSMSIDELRQLYLNMEPILDHNATLLAKQFPNKSMSQKFSEANPVLKRKIWEIKTRS